MQILVPLDESEGAEVVFSSAVSLARIEGAGIRLLEVVAPLGSVIKTGNREIYVDPELPDRMRRATSYLLSAADRLEREGIIVSVDVVIGEIFEITKTIVDYAGTHGIELIIWPPVPLGRAPLLSTMEGFLQSAELASSIGDLSNSCLKNSASFLYGNEVEISDCKDSQEKSTNDTAEV